MRRLRLLILVTLLMPSAVAASYHVDYVGGNDDADGLSPATAFQHTPGDPQATGVAARCIPAPSDRIRFKGGVVYRGGIVVAWSGAPEKPIICDGNSDGSYGTGKAILEGSQPVTGWTRCATAAEADGNEHFQHLWKLQLPVGTTAWSANLLQDGRTLCVAQFPTPADFAFTDVHAEFVQTTAGQLRLNAVTHPILAELGGERLVGCYLQAYRSTNRVDLRKILSWDAATGTATFADLTTPPYPDRGAIAVVNSAHSKVLDMPGEYVVFEQEQNGPTALLWPLDQQDPNAAGMTMAKVETACTINYRVHDVHFTGFQVRNYQYGVNNVLPGHWNTDAERNRGLRIAGNSFERIRASGSARTCACNLVQVEDSVIEDNTIVQTFKAKGICLHTAWHCAIRRNTLDYIAGGPITVFMTTASEIIGNRVSNSAATHTNGITVYESSRDIVVADNVVWNSNVAMTCEKSENITIRGNVFDSRENGMQPLSFWHAVSGDILIEENILLGGPPQNQGFTIAGLGDKTGETFAKMQTILRNNIMSGPMLMVMSGKPWTKNLTVGGNVYLSIPSDYALGQDERIEPDLSKLIEGIPERRYRRLAPRP